MKKLRTVFVVERDIPEYIEEGRCDFMGVFGSKEEANLFIKKYMKEHTYVKPWQWHVTEHEVKF